MFPSPAPHRTCIATYTVLQVQEQEWQWKDPEPPTATGFSPTDKRQPFLAWLDGNVGAARCVALLYLPPSCTLYSGYLCCTFTLLKLILSCGSTLPRVL